MLLAAALMVHSVSVPGTGLHVKLATQAGQPYDARTVTKDVRWLWSLGRFDDVRVEEPTPGALVFRVTPRPRLVLRDARLMPHSYGIDLRLPRGTPIDPMSAREIARGVEGQLGLSVEEKLTPRPKGKADLELRVIGEKKAKRAPPSEEIRYEIAKDVCRDLFRERAGSLDFRAEFRFEGGLTTERGRPYRVGRIEFMGHHRVADSRIRRHLQIDEGAPYDERLLRRSIARLNRSGWFEPIDPGQALLARDEEAGIVNVTLRLKERRRGFWNFGGPWPLRASVGYGPLSVMQYSIRRAPAVALYGLAPQLGARGMAANYLLPRVHGRLARWIAGDGPVEGPLRVGGDIAAVCVAKPRLRILRTGAAAALGLLGR